MKTNQFEAFFRPISEKKPELYEKRGHILGRRGTIISIRFDLVKKSSIGR